MNDLNDYRIGFGQLDQIGTVWPATTQSWQWLNPVEPTNCSGDIHVFPCPHCDKCKCGQAVKTEGKK